MRFQFFMLLLVITGTSYGQTPSQAIESALESNRRALAAQQRIDSIYAERLKILSDISTIEQAGSVHALRNRDIEQQQAALNQNLAEIDTDLRAVTETQTGIITLLGGMIDALEQFIELDLPFEPEKRLAKIRTLRGELSSADSDVTEKYQSVVSAYLSEIRLGYNHSVTQQRIETPDGIRIAEVLRIGRAGLWYVTPDGAQAGRWDPVRRQWTNTDTEIDMVLSGIRMVRESAGSAMLTLPIQLDILE